MFWFCENKLLSKLKRFTRFQNEPPELQLSNINGYTTHKNIWVYNKIAILWFSLPFTAIEVDIPIRAYPCVGNELVFQYFWRDHNT